MRALAVLMVLAAHWTGRFLDWHAIPAPDTLKTMDALGDAGVEIFFALSGFLIGRILIGLVQARPSWRDFAVFMARRGLRTLPLYFLWLALLLCLFPPHQYIAATALRFATMTQNLAAPWPADFYFIVSWSLAVEEWFYLLFGLALIVLARHLGGRKALWCCLALFLIAPLLWRLHAWERGPMVFSRIDEIAYGVLMARLYLDGSALYRWPKTLLAIGSAMILTSLGGWLPPPLTANAQVIGAALCLPATLRLSHMPAWLERPTRWIAARSYALYLMHLTLLVDVTENLLFKAGHLPVAGCIAVAVVTPFLLAELSYRWIEAPVLALRPRQQRRAAAQPIARAGAVMRLGAII